MWWGTLHQIQFLPFLVPTCLVLFRLFNVLDRLELHHILNTVVRYSSSALLSWCYHYLLYFILFVSISWFEAIGNVTPNTKQHQNLLVLVKAYDGNNLVADTKIAIIRSDVYEKQTVVIFQVRTMLSFQTKPIKCWCKLKPPPKRLRRNDEA